MSYILAVDQGTTSSRAILFDREGAPVAVAQRDIEQIYPRPGWVEHDPADIWSTQRDVMAEALREAGVTAREIAAVGITNQRETTILWERSTGEPIHNAIVWQDRRTTPLCKRLRADGFEGLFQAKTGLLLDPYFSGTKLAWLLDNVEGARPRAERGELAFGTVDAWLAYKLSGDRLHITDVSNASRTLLLNIHSGDWDDELLDLLRIPRALLPEVRSSSEAYGEIARDLPCGGATLAGIAGDQQAATMGQVCVKPGMAKNTYGTGCFLLLNTGEAARKSHNKLLSTVAWQRGGARTYALEGSVFVGGAIVQWLRDGLKIIEKAEEVEALAGSVADTGGVELVPALAGLGAPHWDPSARGVIVGITRGTTGAHIARAALEGVALEVADLAQAMQADAGLQLSELRVDGGAAVNDLLMQFQADVLQTPVVRPQVLETTALGAAYMAGLAVGYWKSLDEIEANWRVERRFEPRLDRCEAQARRERWARAVERARGWEQEERS